MALLGGVRVVCVSAGTAGPLATQLLVEAGADVVRVDPPGATRSEDDLVRLRGQRSIVVDWASPDGQALLGQLVAGADVLISEPGLDGRNPVSTDYARLAAQNPRLVYCRLTGYGDDGPLAGGWVDDHLVAARYGVHDQPGWRPGPTFLVMPVPSLGSALLAVQAIGSALYMRERTGLGQEVTTSLLAGALAFQPGMAMAQGGKGGMPVRLTPFRGPSGSMPLYSIYECRDGAWLHIGCLSPQFQERGMRALEITDALKELGFGTPRELENQAQIVACIRESMLKRTYAEWAALFESMDVPYAPSQWTEDLLDDPQVAHEGLLITLDDPVRGPMEQGGPVFTIEGEASRPLRPAPAPGQDTDEVCRERGLSDERIAALRRAGAIA